MHRRRLAIVASLAVVAACGGGPPSPPALEYGHETVDLASYAVSDTAVVAVSAMGQSIEITQRGTAVYGVRFQRAASGVEVTVTVDSLAGSISNPMGAPLRLDESAVQGALVFTLDRVGNPTVSRWPTVRPEASQLVSPVAIAHNFFPALPGRAAGPGVTWVDSIRYDGSERGGLSESSVLEYAVVGDTTIAGRSLHVISFEGTTTLEGGMNVSGMDVSQRSELEVRGRVLWDAPRGVMYESVTEATGRGTVSVPISPFPLPVELRAKRRARLR